MKSSELLQLYRSGKTDFSRESIRGQTFVGEDLSGIDLSYADIRGANFSKASLEKANFRGARTGLQRRWAIVVIIGLLVFLALSSFPLALGCWWLPWYFLPKITQKYTAFPGFLISLGFLVPIRIITYQPLETALGFIAGIGAVVVAGTAVLGVVGTADISLALALTVVAAVVGVASSALAGASAITATRIISSTKVSILVVVSAAVLAGILAAASAHTIVSTDGSIAAQNMLEAGREDQGTFMAASGGVLSIVLSSYISRKTLIGDERYNLTRKLAGVFAAVKGTTFKDANLTNANFTRADLKSSDFREAILICTRWYCAESLSWTRTGESYLQHRSVRQLITRMEGEGSTFDEFNLRGINLEGANLVRASFVGTNLEEASLENAHLEGASLIGANLNKANLRNTDLKMAKLVQTQLDETDLRGANLTAAYIEDWGITTQTNLEEVRCDFIYMRLPSPNDPDRDCRRKPDDDRKEFAEGEFSDFIAPMVHTLDLYHHQKVDPRILALSIKALYEKHIDADIKLASIERKGQRGNILVRLATTKTANHSELGADYSDIFEERSALPSDEIKSILEESGVTIQTLANLLAFATNQKDKYLPINNHYYLGDIKMNEGQQRISISNSSVGQLIGGDASIDGVVNLGEISGVVKQLINELPTSNQLDKYGLKEILSELESTISSEDSLSDEGKAEALEQIGKIAEAGKKPDDNAMRKLARQASTMLKGISAQIPDAIKLTEACNKLLPLIAKIFGI